MSDLLHDERLRALLAQARQAWSIRADLLGRSESTAHVDEALDTLFRDLGRALFERVRLDAAVLIPDADDDDPTHFTSELEREDTESWYADEAEVPDDDDLDDLPALPRRDDLPPDGALVPFDAIAARLRPSVDAPWAPALAELLDLLELPTDLDDPQELSVEASRVQWAASEVPVGLGRFPEPVRLALIGLLAVRARHLLARLDVGVGPRMALDRLRRHREEAGLPLVAALASQPTPETGGWADDARAFWSLLAGCARPQA